MTVRAPDSHTMVYQPRRVTRRLRPVDTAGTPDVHLTPFSLDQVREQTDADRAALARADAKRERRKARNLAVAAKAGVR